MLIDYENITRIPVAKIIWGLLLPLVLPSTQSSHSSPAVEIGQSN